MTARKSKTEQEPEPLVGSGLGQVAYEAYVARQGIKTPEPWGELEYDVAAAWCAAGQAVIAATIGRNA